MKITTSDILKILEGKKYSLNMYNISKALQDKSIFITNPGIKYRLNKMVEEGLIINKKCYLGHYNNYKLTINKDMNKKIIEQLYKTNPRWHCISFELFCEFQLRRAEKVSFKIK